MSHFYIVSGFTSKGHYVTKAGKTADIDQRLARHARQGLTEVRYRRQVSASTATALEAMWRSMRLQDPSVHTTRHHLTDGWSEAVTAYFDTDPFIAAADAFIDARIAYKKARDKATTCRSVHPAA